MPNSGRPRVLITRLSHIGDCVLSLPVLCALRDHYPKAFLAWIVERPSAKILRGHKALDELIVVEPGWLKSPRAVWKLRRQLRGLRFDVALDPQGLTKSSVCGWLAGAKLRIGYHRRDGRELSSWLNNCLIQRRRLHMVDRGLELLRPLRVFSPHVRFDLPIDDASHQNIDDFLNRQGLTEGFAVINPGAGWDSKLWPTERYSEVARHLGGQRSVPTVVVWAGEREHQWAEEIVAASGGHAQTAPQTTLQELAALLMRCRLFIGSDTGPMHMAAAVGAACVALHGPTPPAKSGPYGSQHVSIREAYVPRKRRKHPSSQKAMRAITADQVCAACDRLLVGGVLPQNARAA